MPWRVPIKASTNTTNDSEQHQDVERYAELVGCLMWLYVATRPDLGFAATFNARFTARATTVDYHRALGALRYLKATRTRGLHYTPLGCQLLGYSDSSHGDDVSTRRSSQGCVFKLADGPVAWHASLQTLVTLSSFEAEYVALMHTTKEAIHLIHLLQELPHCGLSSSATTKRPLNTPMTLP